MIGIATAVVTAGIVIWLVIMNGLSATLPLCEVDQEELSSPATC